MEALTVRTSPSTRNGHTMRAAVIVDPRAVRLEERPIPDPGPQQVRVRLEGCGVCGSNLPPWEGREWFEYPMEAGSPGHEGWGTVDAVGSEVGDLEPGERVAMLSYNAFAEYDLADCASVVRLPDSLRAHPFPGEPLGCAMNVYRRAEIKAGQTVAIIGIGFLGALLTQLVSRAGARVVAISRRPYSLDVGRESGADEMIPMEDHGEIIDRVRDLTDGAMCERVIEAVGLQWPLDLAGELTAERGRLVVAGYHQDGARQVNMQLWNWRGIDVINAHERETAVYVRGMQDAVRAVERGELDPYPLFTHTLPADQISDGLNLLAERPDGFVKALIQF